ncbi:MAG: DUF4468 domain-containing protein, partial [Bacteroidota bacterium]
MLRPSIALSILVLIIGNSLNAQAKIPGAKSLKQVNILLSRIEGEYKLEENGFVVYQEVSESKGDSAEILFSRALEFFALNSAKYNLSVSSENRTNGLLIGTGTFQNVATFKSIPFGMEFSLRIDVKDEKFRAT